MEQKFCVNCKWFTEPNYGYCTSPRNRLDNVTGEPQRILAALARNDLFKACGEAGRFYEEKLPVEEQKLVKTTNLSEHIVWFWKRFNRRFN